MTWPKGTTWAEKRRQIQREARRAALEEAAAAIKAESFQVVTQDQVDLAKAVRDRYIAAIRSLIDQDKESQE